MIRRHNWRKNPSTFGDWPEKTDLGREHIFYMIQQKSRLIPNTTARTLKSHGLVSVILLGVMLAVPAAFAADDAVKQRYAEYCSVCHGDRGDGRSMRVSPRPLRASGLLPRLHTGFPEPP